MIDKRSYLFLYRFANDVVEINPDRDISNTLIIEVERFNFDTDYLFGRVPLARANGQPCTC
jgi:hypothetical protein